MVTLPLTSVTLQSRSGSTTVPQPGTTCGLGSSAVADKRRSAAKVSGATNGKRFIASLSEQELERPSIHTVGCNITNCFWVGNLLQVRLFRSNHFQPGGQGRLVRQNPGVNRPNRNVRRISLV